MLGYFVEHQKLPSLKACAARFGICHRTSKSDRQALRESGRLAGAITRLVAERATTRYFLDEVATVTINEDGTTKTRISGPSVAEGRLALDAAEQIRRISPEDDSHLDLVADGALVLLGKLGTVEREDIRRLVEQQAAEHDG